MHLYSQICQKTFFTLQGRPVSCHCLLFRLLFGMQWRVINNQQLVGGCLTGSVSLADSNNDYSVLISDLTE